MHLQSINKFFANYGLTIILALQLHVLTAFPQQQKEYQPLIKYSLVNNERTRFGPVESFSSFAKPEDHQSLNRLLSVRSNVLDDESQSRSSRQLIKINYPGFNSTVPSARTRITVSGASIRDRLLPFSVFNLTSNVRPEVTDTLVDPSHVITVPSRIILPENALKPEKQTIKVTMKQKDYGLNQTLPRPDSRCPTFGILTFEHSAACDKYYYCEDGLMSEVTCPNGLMYGTRDVVINFCVHRWKTVCGDKSIPDPISSPGCRWQYGIFHVQGSPKCSQNYYECVAGKYKIQRCITEGQVYDDRSKSCQPAQVVGCPIEKKINFNCPPDDQNNAFWPFPRYFLNERALIHCVNDKPEVIRCSMDEQVDPEFLHCVPLAH